MSKAYVPMRLSFVTPSVPDAPEVVVGRDELTNALWADLAGSSARLLSERRMGKTWLLMLARARAPQWAATMFFDAEPAHDACDFVLRLNRVRHNPKTLTIDPEALLAVLRILRDDHYLVEDAGHWVFKLNVIRSGWFHMRGRQAL